jgi:hypothetical protein
MHNTSPTRKNQKPMPKKPERKPDDPEQSKRFIDTAKEVEAEDSKALDRAFKKVAQQPKQPPSAKK